MSEELTLTFEQTLILLAILTPINLFIWFGIGWEHISSIASLKIRQRVITPDG